MLIDQQEIIAANQAEIARLGGKGRGSQGAGVSISQALSKIADINKELLIISTQEDAQDFTGSKTTPSQPLTDKQKLAIAGIVLGVLIL